MRINRDAIGITPDDLARLLKPLLVAVVAWITQRLPIAGIPEQLLRFGYGHLIARCQCLAKTMGDDVIHHAGSCNLPQIVVHLAQRMLPQPVRSGPHPSRTIDRRIAVCLTFHGRRAQQKAPRFGSSRALG